MHTPSDGGPVASQDAWRRPFVKQHQQWCDDFVLELRMRDVPGAVIGDHLAEVEAHCVESGESPAEAFGPATDYARRLDTETEPGRVGGSWTVGALAAGKVIALIVGTSAAFPWVRGEELTYNGVQLASLAVVLIVLLSLPLLVRLLIERPWRVGLPLIVVGALAGAGSAAGGRLDLPTVLSLPAAVVTLGLFVVVLVMSWAEYRVLGGEGDGDPVISPLTPPDAVQPRRRRWPILLPALLVPIAYVMLTAVTFALG